MPEKSKRSERKAIDRPFDKAILARAKEVVSQYQIVLERLDDGWYGHGLELPGAMGDGKTADAAVTDTREAMTAMAAYMIEEGQPLPVPARGGNRSMQVNIRLTPEEKALLESRSRAKGFRGVSDYIRAAVMAEK